MLAKVQTLCLCTFTLSNLLNKIHIFTLQHMQKSLALFRYFSSLDTTLHQSNEISINKSNAGGALTVKLYDDKYQY